MGHTALGGAGKPIAQAILTGHTAVIVGRFGVMTDIAEADIESAEVAVVAFR